MRKRENPLASAMNRAAGADSQGVEAGTDDAAGPAVPTPGATRRPPSRQGKKGVVFHVDPEIAKRLKILSAEHDTSIEALGVEALTLLFKHYEDRK